MQATYALPSEALKKNSSTADMIPADLVAETENGKMSLNWKVFPVQWRRIFEKYQHLTKWRSVEKKVCFLAYKMVVFVMPKRQFSFNQKYHTSL